MEEGEIDDGSEDSHPGCGWTADKHTHAWLLLALFERMSGEGLHACKAVEKALVAASGNAQVGPLQSKMRQCVRRMRTWTWLTAALMC